MKRFFVLCAVMSLMSTAQADDSVDSIVIRKHFEAGQFTPVCLPFNVSSEQLAGEVFAIGSIKGREATIYPVDTISAGCPFVVRSAVNIDSIVVAKTDVSEESFKEQALIWDGGSVKGNIDDYSWVYINMNNRSLRSVHMSYHVLDMQQMDFTVNLENLRVRRYLHDAHYELNTESCVANYMLTPEDRLDFPNGVTVPLPVAEESTLVFSEEEDLTGADTIYVPAGQQSYCIYNLIPQRTYHYQVTVADSIVTKGCFHTSGHLRTIRVPSIWNVRDMGGWQTEDGRRMKYGLLYRGGELNGNHTASYDDVVELKRLGIAAEIDLRWNNENSGAGRSAFGFKDSNQMVDGETPSYLFTNNSGSNVSHFVSNYYLQRWKREFEFIIANLKEGRAIYHHCAWGADRTGVLSMLLEGMLGVTFDNIIKDYEVTAFAEGGISKSRLQPILDYLNGLEGNTFSDKVTGFWLNSVQVSQTDIDYFKSVMLEEVNEVSDPFSGTLPVVYINAEDSILSKDNYVNATFHIDPLDYDEFESVGTAAEPLPLLIRGRGHWTWFGSFEKKPYKLKLEKGKSLLGMASNKHFALLAHADGGEKAFFRNTAGFELGRMVGLDFTPHQQPVELMLNGEYQGLYFLTETVRVGKHRVNITEQDNLQTNPDSISGGWLVEIDNADEENQISFPLDGTELTRFCLTYHSPEQLSEVQYDYLYQQFMGMLQAVYVADKESQEWESYIDVESLAKYYLVNEILDHLEAFLGSCYLYKDLGETTWKFGPLWDLGHAFNDWHDKDKFIYDYVHETEDDFEPCIMEEIAKFPRMQEAILALWTKCYPQVYDELDEYLHAFAAQIKQAAILDHQRWPLYGTADAEASLELCLDRLYEKRDFLISEWGDGGITDHLVSPFLPTSSHPSVYNLQGQRVSNPSAHGLYIRNGRKYFR